MPKSFKNPGFLSTYGGIGNAWSSAPSPPPPSHPFLNPSFSTQTELLPSKFVLFVFIYEWKKKEKSTSITDMPWLETE